LKLYLSYVLLLKKHNLYLNGWLVIVLLAFLLGSCSTKKNSFTRRFYHNMTAHYNGYFNGNEALKEGVVALDKATIDDYSKILQIYRLGTEADATSQNANFDKAYTKSSTVIQKHSIFKKNKEYVRWIPEAYLLIGKSYFYKKEYKLAAETFDYVAKQYTNWPIKYNAMLWMVRCYNEQKKYEKSESTLALVESKIEKDLVPKSVKKEYPVVYADYLIKKESYEQSIEYLMSGIDLNKKKSLNVRLCFILAQVYQETGNIAGATKMYDKVISKNPAYEMEFNAKINKAICFDATKGDSKSLKKLLNKMARETKNKDYLDQIYYALAEICMKEKDTTCAIDNYKLSAIKSVSNTKQKATSYLKLANIYFSMPEYELAEAYYDSTMTVLPEDYPDYAKIKSLSAILSDLVDNIKVVELQDSLQKLSKMSVTERDQVINDIITNVIKEEQKKKEEEYLKQQNIYTANENTIATTNATSWYFYNPTTVNFGKTEFIKKWGSRKLEDLWRLTEKQAVDPFADNTNYSDTASGDSTGTTVNNLKDKDYYLKDIPVTAEDLAASDDKIAAALYNIAQIYQNDLLDYTKAIETYEDLMKRFPAKEDYMLKTYYQLYLVYDQLSDAGKSDYYKNLVCTKGPQSDFCNLIKDPNYKKVTTETKNLATTLYTETYDAYIISKWDSVLAKTTRAISLYSNDTSLVPKFSYLKAVALGKTHDSTAMVTLLKNIIDTYPGSNVKPRAQMLYDFCTGKTSANVAVKQDSSTTAATETYKLDADAIHLYVLVISVKDKTVKVNDIKNAISDYNTANYSATKLTVSNVFLDNTRQLMTVANFDSKAKAMLYFNGIKSNTTIFGKLKPSDYSQFVISVDNYPSMYKKKDIENYYLFFLDNYLK
jgi:tetratricopeptide (TPR) repeat protein